MGLDLVELTMEIEDHFGIDIPDRDASQLETVGQVYDYLRQRLRSQPTATCASMSVFYKLRKSLLDSGVPRAKVTPSVLIGEVLSDPSPELAARRLQTASGLTLPPVVRKVTKQATDWSAVVLICALAVAPFTFLRSDMAGMVAIFFAGAAVWAIGRVSPAWNPQRVLTSDPLATLVGKVVVINDCRKRSTEWTDEKIWLGLKHIVSEQLGVPLEAVVPEAHFIRDFHAG